MKEVIQHLLFPDDESLVSCWPLFHRGDRGILTGIGADASLCVGKYNFVEFNTYLNGVSYNKWKKYTDLQKLSLQLTISGDFEITLVGF